jgi:hypothetical protein
LQHTLCLKNHLLPIMKAPLSLSLSLSQTDKRKIRRECDELE